MPQKDSSRGGVVLALTCEQCGTAFTRYASEQRSPRTFCSRACRDRSRRLRPESVTRKGAYAFDAKARGAASLRRLYERRRKWYRELMASRTCERCGSVSQLQWRHNDPATKQFHVASDYFTRPRDAVLAEMAKCTVLCLTCHRAVHREMRR